MQDRLLFDLFTTAFNDNATRGQLSVNIPSPNLAAWSAVFSGMVVPTDRFGGYTNINPVAVDVAQNKTNLPLLQISPLLQIVTGINQTRATTLNSDGVPGVFEHVGSILRTPQLSEQSPFLTKLDPTSQISDEMVEWLPQQMLSLVRVGSPRYVIYAYGQGLKPAPAPNNGVFVGGSICPTITSGVGMRMRAVARIETMRTNRNDGTITVTPPRAVIEKFNILPPD